MTNLSPTQVRGVKSNVGEHYAAKTGHQFDFVIKLAGVGRGASALNVFIGVASF